MTIPSLHCLHILRNADFNHYIACLFTPSKKRAALAAIWAFHVEISKIIEQVKQPLIGEIRLRWWCDEIESHAALTTNHTHNEKQNPLLFALTQTIEHYKLPQKPFIAAIEARIDLLYEQNLTPLTAEFNLYAQATTGLFFQLSCQILNSNSHDSSSHEKIAATCYHAAQAETLWRHWRWQKANPAALTHAPPLDEQIIAAIMHHYKAFAGQITQLPRTLRPAFLSLAPLSCFDGSDDDLSSLRRLWLIARTALFGRF